MSRKPIRLIVVDDHQIMREGLIRLLGHTPDLRVVGLASSGREAIDLVQRETADVILLDIVMDDMSGLEAARRILSMEPAAKIIMLTMYEEKAFFFDALQTGARGYFLKGSNSDELINTIRNVHKGGTYLDPKMAGRLVKEYLETRTETDSSDNSVTDLADETEQ